MKSEQELATAEIMHMFRYFYKEMWAPGNIFDGKSRIWIQVFNDMIEKGLIERKKVDFGYQYRWKSVWPGGF